MAYDALPTFSFNTNHRSLSLGWPQSRVSWGTLFRAPCGAKACRVLLCFGVALLLPGRDNTSDDRMTLLCVRVRPPVIPPCIPPPVCVASRSFTVLQIPCHKLPHGSQILRPRLSTQILRQPRARYALSFHFHYWQQSSFFAHEHSSRGDSAPCLQPTSPVSKSPVTHFVCRWRHSGS